MISGSCLICEEDILKKKEISDDTFSFKCRRCGEYTADKAALDYLYSLPLKWYHVKHLLSHYVKTNDNPNLTIETIERVCSGKKPSLHECASLLLQAINKRINRFGDSIKLPKGENTTSSIISECSARDFNELGYILTSYMRDQLKWVTVAGLGIVDGYLIHITPSGHNYLEQLKYDKKEGSIAFCAMWFDEGVKHVWDDAISPAILQSGFEPVRIDGVPHVNKICDEIVSNIRRSRFVVADFTGHRGGVYFEAGFAMGLGIPVIWTVREDDLEKLHFDIRQYLFLTWEKDKIGDFRNALATKIQAVIGMGPLIAGNK